MVHLMRFNVVYNIEFGGAEVEVDIAAEDEDGDETAKDEGS